MQWWNFEVQRTRNIFFVFPLFIIWKKKTLCYVMCMLSERSM